MTTFWGFCSLGEDDDDDDDDNDNESENDNGKGTFSTAFNSFQTIVALNKVFVYTLGVCLTTQPRN